MLRYMNNHSCSNQGNSDKRNTVSDNIFLYSLFCFLVCNELIIAGTFTSPFHILIFLLNVTRCGFGLLMYGFGSKKALIEDFASAALTEYSVLVINGYLPSINLKQVDILKYNSR